MRGSPDAASGSIVELQQAWREAAGFTATTGKGKASSSNWDRPRQPHEITFKTVAEAALRANRSRKTSPVKPLSHKLQLDDSDDDAGDATPVPKLAREAAAAFARHGKIPTTSPSPPHRNPNQRNSTLQARVHEVSDATQSCRVTGPGRVVETSTHVGGLRCLSLARVDPFLSI